MYSRVAATAIFSVLATQALAQDGYPDSTYPYGSDPYGSDPYGSTPTFAGNPNVISEYPDIATLLSAIAPDVTSIGPLQASLLEEDLEDFYYTYTAANPVPTILNDGDVYSVLEDPDQDLTEKQVSEIEELLEYPNEPDALSSMASILSGNSASAYVMSYASAEVNYQNSISAAIAPIVLNDLSLSGASSSFTSPASASASVTGTFSFRTTSAATTLSTTATKSSTGSLRTSSATNTKNSTSATGSSTGSGSTSSTSASNSVSSGLAAPTAGPQLLVSAVVAAAGVVGMAIL